MSAIIGGFDYDMPQGVAQQLASDNAPAHLVFDDDPVALFEEYPSDELYRLPWPSRVRVPRCRAARPDPRGCRSPCARWGR